MKEQGMLYICGTPLGNLSDISYRCLEVLNQVDLIGAEDTRVTGKLLSKYNITTPMISYHTHNEISKTYEIIERIKDGLNVAIVSDAGMPCISDPGEEVIKACYEENILVTTIPSGSAFTMALVLSGFSTRRFIYEGFLPSKNKEKKEILSFLENEHRTMIFYEAPHRILDTLKELKNTFGENRNIALVRELTKIYEEVQKGTILELIEYYSNNKPRGEFVIVVEGKSLESIKQDSIEDFLKLTVSEHIEIYTAQGIDEKSAMKLVAKDRGVSKSVIYKEYKI